MKKIAVIGASYLQLPLVQKARSMGMETICFAWPEGAVCKDACDRFYPISIVEKEKICAMCQEHGIDGILSIASDVAVPTISYIAGKMNLVGNSEHSAYLSTNKYAMRKALTSKGVRCPVFVHFSTLSEALSAAARIGFPVIVKPCDRSGSLGVSKVSDIGELPHAAELALDESFSHEAMIEQCIEIANEISIEGISWHGEYHALAVTDKATTGSPHYVEIGQHQPSTLPDHIQKAAMAEAKKGVDALEIQYGASHAELMVTASEEIYVTEIGGRMGGDFIGSDLVPLSTGYDFLRGVIEVALGDFSEMTPGERHFSGVWFYTQNTPSVKEWIINRKEHPEIIRCELNGNELRPLLKSGDRSGYFIYQNDSRIELEEIENHD